MVSNFTRLIATACIWGMTPLIILAATDSAVRDLNAVILVAIVMFAAAFSTRAVWNNVTETAQTMAEKSKRTGSRRVNRLMDGLSDDELDELRSRLSGDGEMVPLESLIQQRGGRRSSPE